MANETNGNGNTTLRKPRTLAEAQGMTAEIGRAIAEVAQEELEAGRLARG